MKNVLVSGPFAKEDLAELAGSANLYFLRDMSREDVEALLPSIDCILVHFWPKELTIEMVTNMTRLSFVQSALAAEASNAAIVGATNLPSALRIIAVVRWFCSA